MTKAKHSNWTLLKTRPITLMVLRVYGIIYTYILFCECDSEETLKMQNEEGQITELYIPRKWYNISGYFDCYLVMEFEKRVFGFVSVLLQIDWLLPRITLQFRLTLVIWMKAVSTMVNFPLLPFVASLAHRSIIMFRIFLIGLCLQLCLCYVWTEFELALDSVWVNNINAYFYNKLSWN